MRSFVLGLALVTVPAVAWAQDQEDRKSEIKPKIGKVETEIELETEVHTYNNLDFRPLDETSDQTILDSDDRNTFAFTGLDVGIGVSINPQLSVNIAASHRGLWGNDQIGGVNAFGGFLYVTDLSVDWMPLAKGENEENPLRLRVGRQYFDLGATGRDYVYSDVIDGVRLDVPLGKIGHITALPFSIFSSSGDAANANFFDYIGQSTTQTFGFRGAHITSRYGGELVVDGAVKGLDLRAYAFYTDIGAAGSGSDISYDGTLGNFSDNDWVVNYGLRAKYEVSILEAWGEFAGSSGIDRKELIAQDVDTQGFAWGAGAKVDSHRGEETGYGGTLDYWEAQGPTYTENGLMFSHGYVGMKGKQVGGLVTDRFLGWHPSSYVGMFGVDDSPHEPDRKTGTRVVHAGAFAQPIKLLEINADWWMFSDTGLSAVNIAGLDDIVPPYGYSRAEFAAEERLGKALGMEIDGKVKVNVNDHLSFHANTGVFLPGAFYGIEIDRSAGDQLGGQSLAWAANGGATVEF